jgi:hypothetical protein
LVQEGLKKPSVVPVEMSKTWVVTHNERDPAMLKRLTHAMIIQAKKCCHPLQGVAVWAR